MDTKTYETLKEANSAVAFILTQGYALDSYRAEDIAGLWARATYRQSIIDANTVILGDDIELQK